jgi:hypothetical protein
MSRRGGLLAGFGRLMLYPAIRSVEAVNESRGNLAASLKEMRERRAALHERLKQAAPAGEASDAERFEALVELHGWTEPALAEQLLAVRRTKLFAIISTGIGFILALVAMVAMPQWMLLFLLPGTLLLCTMGGSRVFLMGLYQAQLESRRLLKAQEYLSRPDLFRHLVG